MSFKKFNSNEVMINTMRTYPQSEFIIFDGTVYYNSRPNQSGSRHTRVRNVDNGFVSLYELNIDRPEVATGRYIGPQGEPEDGEVDTRIPDNARIYPWISKDSAGASFKTAGGFKVSDASWNNEFEYGDILRGKYPLSASITREFISSTNQSPYVATHPSSSTPAGAGTYNASYMAIRNALNYHSLQSEHYAVTSSHGNKDTQKLNLIHIPSIFYGSKIKPGSVKLEWYYTGSLIGVVTDHNKNGELIQTYGPNSEAVQFNNKVAGVVLYEEGMIVLTGSWRLNNNKNIDFKDTSGNRNPRWIYFGAGANDGQARTQTRFGNASYKLTFKGVNETQVMTMFANARKGQVNYSNNPTFLKFGQSKIFTTSSNIYEENSELQLVNFVSSSYVDYGAPFRRQVYISRIGIYDKNKNLLGVATLGSPILKKDDQDITFKLKIDI